LLAGFKSRSWSSGCSKLTKHFIELLSARNILLYQLQTESNRFRFHDSQLPYCVSGGVGVKKKEENKTAGIQIVASESEI